MRATKSGRGGARSVEEVAPAGRKRREERAAGLRGGRKEGRAGWRAGGGAARGPRRPLGLLACCTWASPSPTSGSTRKNERT